MLPIDARLTLADVRAHRAVDTRTPDTQEDTPAWWSAEHSCRTEQDEQVPRRPSRICTHSQLKLEDGERASLSIHSDRHGLTILSAISASLVVRLLDEVTQDPRVSLGRCFICRTSQFPIRCTSGHTLTRHGAVKGWSNLYRSTARR